MKSLLLTTGAIACVLSLGIGLGSASASANRSSGKTTRVAIASSGLGRILTDGRGRTLYLFAGDANGRSNCSGRCAAFWPPLLASGKPRATAGAKASLLGTTRRADGRVQVTYNHHPLYRFVKDVRKGQTNGEAVDAFGAEWYALSATGAKVDEDVTKSTDPAAGGDTGGYGY